MLNSGRHEKMASRGMEPASATAVNQGMSGKLQQMLTESRKKEILS